MLVNTSLLENVILLPSWLVLYRIWYVIFYFIRNQKISYENTVWSNENVLVGGRSNISILSIFAMASSWATNEMGFRVLLRTIRIKKYQGRNNFGRKKRRQVGLDMALLI